MNLDTAVGIAGAFKFVFGTFSNLQKMVVEQLIFSLTGLQINIDDASPIPPAILRDRLAPVWRNRVVNTLIIAETIVNDPRPQIVGKIETYSKELNVCQEMSQILCQMANGHSELAQQQFAKLGYEANWNFAKFAPALHIDSTITSPWQNVIDPVLGARWEGLKFHKAGTLGRGVWEFYDARGFNFPGRFGAAPPMLAQHDWVHVLADYGSTLESEIEIFSFISWANNNPNELSLQVAILSLFETGKFRTGLGLFESFPGILSAQPHDMAIRMADAIRRGMACYCDDDLLAIDWFKYADWPLIDIRKKFNIVPKSVEAVKAGSAGPNQIGGISPFQLNAGKVKAEKEGRTYNGYGSQLPKEQAK